MNWLIYVFGSGIAFFIGIALLVLAVAGAHAKSNTIVRISLVVLILGLALLVLSATPLPFWLWYLLGGSFINWTICSLFKRYAKPASIVLLAICSLAVVFEIQWHFKPRVTIASSKKLTVVGDSVTAGTGNNDKTIKWPDQLSRDFSILIDNRSVPGAKCSTALKQLQSAPVTSSVVLLEIGGNDLLGSTSDKKYRQDLERLLQFVCNSNRQIFMLELPLPPLRNRYGMIQRELASKYNVELIPKRDFVAVLTGPDSTIDSVHLTQTGHDRMAETIWRAIGDCFQIRGR